MMSKSEGELVSETSPEATCLPIGRHPVYRRHELNPGFSTERGRLVQDAKGKPYKSYTKGESTDARARVGSSHRSVHDSATGLAGRGRPVGDQGQSEMRGAVVCCVAPRSRDFGGMAGRSRMSREAHVRSL